MRSLKLALVAVSLCFGGAGCRASVDPTLVAQFRDAQETFDKAKTADEFLRAASMYQQITDAGIRSGAVLYNQGNAYMRAGQRGRAIACYRQAQRYLPNDSVVEASLRSALPDNAAVTPPRPLIEYILFWQNSISYPGKFRLSLGMAAGTLVLGLVSLFVTTVIWRRLAFVGLLCTLALVLSALYDWYRFVHIQHGVIVNAESIARKGDADSYQPAFTRPLSEGTECQVLEHRRGWSRIRLPGSQEGWVRSNELVVY